MKMTARFPVPATASGEGLRTQVARVLDRNWRPEFQFSVPHPVVYPYMWLWDSCFHALVWSALGDGRAVKEMAGVFSAQTPSGFLPHINYAADPSAFEGFWGKAGSSSLTQPPIYGHALLRLQRDGLDVDRFVGPARRAVDRLFASRRAPSGLLRIVHPWESGMDDHLRWGAWQPDPWDGQGWYETKGRLVRALSVRNGEAVASPMFDVCSASFNAIAAWNARELAELQGDPMLRQRADELAARLDDFWDPDRGTWTDSSPAGDPGSAVRTLDALLPALVTADEVRARSALRSALHPGTFGTPYGPAGVHVAEPGFISDGYWRGGSWPPVIYLLWVAACRWGFSDLAADLAAQLVAGVRASGFSEYWDCSDGGGRGASPHSWSGLAVVVSSPPR